VERQLGSLSLPYNNEMVGTRYLLREQRWDFLPFVKADYLNRGLDFGLTPAPIPLLNVTTECRMTLLITTERRMNRRRMNQLGMNQRKLTDVEMTQHRIKPNTDYYPTQNRPNVE
jgi:hypothetical protein